MDQNAALKRWRNAMACEDWQDAADARRALLQWLSMGGAAPAWHPGEEQQMRRQRTFAAVVVWDGKPHEVVEVVAAGAISAELAVRQVLLRYYVPGGRVMQMQETRD